MLEVAIKASLDARFMQRLARFVFQRLIHRSGTAGGKESAAQTSDAEAGRLLGSENDQFNGPPRRESRLFQRTNRLQPA